MTADSESSFRPPAKREQTASSPASTYPSNATVLVIFLAIWITVFLCALDGTIIATALPTISSHFNDLGDYSWYSGVYLLTVCAFQLPFGRAYTLLKTNWTFAAAILIFEIGSTISGAAPNSIAFILGRAIAGVGGSGIFGGAFIIVAKTVPLRRRSLFNGLLGAVWAIASVVGPILGGAFTTKVTWRWCFYINLPLGAVVIPIVLFILPNALDADDKSKVSLRSQTIWQMISRFDLMGTVLLIPTLTCLLLALQWGGSVYPWSNGRMIALFVCFGIGIITWGILQYIQGESATVPVDLLHQRGVVAASMYMLLGAAAFMCVIYYLPIWFQAIRQESPVDSGIHNLPSVLSVTFSSITAGGMVFAFGYYTPFLYLGTICMSVGAALLMLLTPHSGIGQWIGYQILFGIGVGVSLEQCAVAMQAVVPAKRISAATSINVFARSLGGTIGISIAENVFTQRLTSGLRKALPSLSPDVVSGRGARNLVANVLKVSGGNEATVTEVLKIYNDAIAAVFMIALIVAALTVLPALAVEWKTVKKAKKEMADGGETGEKDGAQQTGEAKEVISGDDAMSDEKSEKETAQ